MWSLSNSTALHPFHLLRLFFLPPLPAALVAIDTGTDVDLVLGWEEGQKSEVWEAETDLQALGSPSQHSTLYWPRQAE